MARHSILVVLIVTLFFTGDAEAYLDPSTGSMIISAIIGIFASIALALKTYWYKLKALFTGKSAKAAVEDDPASD